MSFAIVSKAQFQVLVDSYANAMHEAHRQGHIASPPLAAIVQQVLSNPGGLVRAQLCLATLQDGKVQPSQQAISLGLGVEYYHLASLLFDDLPCMDNAETRRGQVTAHLLHGEANTILCALALINKAYSLLWAAIADLPAKRRDRCADLIQRCLGQNGVIGGQMLDLGFANQSNVSRRLITKIADQKTGSLFALSMLLPALVAVDDEAELRQITLLARYFGRLYQLIDDFKDISSADIAATKSHRDADLHRPNMVLLLGAQAAQDYLALLFALTQRTVDRLVKRSARWAFYQLLLDKLNDTAQRLVAQ